MSGIVKNLSKDIIYRPIQNIIFLVIILITVGLFTTPYYYLAFVPANVVLLSIFLGRFPHIGYYLVIFLIPFSAYREIKGINIQWILSFFLIIVILFKPVFKGRLPAKLRTNLWPWLMIFLSVSLISTLMSDYRNTAIKNLPLLIVALIFISFNLVFVSRKAFYKTLPLVLIFSISISSFLGLIGYIFNVQFFAENVEEGAFKRCIGLTTDPNNFSLMVIFSLPLLAHWFSSTRKFSCKLFAAIFFIINMTALVCTYSRGGLIIASLVIFLIILEYRHKFKLKYIAFILPLITISFIATLILVPASYWDHQQSIFDTKKKDRSIGRRTSYLYVGADAFKRNPVLGSGPGSFGDIFSTTSYSREFQKSKDVTFKRYAHNTYLEVLVGTGALGLILFIIIIWLAVKDFHIAKNKFSQLGNKAMVSIVRSYQISFLSVLIYLFLFSDIYHKYLLLSLALSQIALNLSNEAENEEYDASLANIN